MSKKIICSDCGSIVECSDTSRRMKCDSCIHAAQQKAQKMTTIKLVIRVTK